MSKFLPKYRNLIRNILLAVLIFFFLLGLSQILMIVGRKYQGVENVLVSNLTENSATLSWTTRKEIFSDARIRENGVTKLGSWRKFSDDRDYEILSQGEYQLIDHGKYYVHKVTFRGLKPNTEYLAVLKNGILRSSSLIRVTTLGVKDYPTRQILLYGKVYNELAKPREDALLIVANGDQKVSDVLMGDGGYSVDISPLCQSSSCIDEIDVKLVSPFGEKIVEVNSESYQPVKSQFFGSNFWLQQVSSSTNFEKPYATGQKHNESLTADENNSSFARLIGKALAQASSCEYMPLDICEFNSDCEIKNGSCQEISGEAGDQDDSGQEIQATCSYSCVRSEVCEANGYLVEGFCENGQVCCEFQQAEEDIVADDDPEISDGDDNYRADPLDYTKLVCKNGVLYDCADDGRDCRIHVPGCGNLGCISIGGDWGRCRSPEEAWLGTIKQEDKIDTEELKKLEKLTQAHEIAEESWNADERVVCTQFGVVTQGQYFDGDGGTHEDFCAIDLSYYYLSSTGAKGRITLPSEGFGERNDPDYEYIGCYAKFDSKTLQNDKTGIGCYTTYINKNPHTGEYKITRLGHLGYNESECSTRACQSPWMGSTGFGDAVHSHYESMQPIKNADIQKFIEAAGLAEAEPDNDALSTGGPDSGEEPDPREYFESINQETNPDYAYKCLENHPCRSIQGGCWVRDSDATCADTKPIDLGVSVFDEEINEYGLDSRPVDYFGSFVMRALAQVDGQQRNDQLDNRGADTMLNEYIEEQGVLSPGEYSLTGFSTKAKSLEVLDTSSVRIYYDENGNGKFDESERQLIGSQLDSQNFSINREIDFFEINFVPGWNLIAIPYVMTGEKTSGIVRASDLIGALQEKDLNCTHVSVFRDGKFIPFSSRIDSEGSPVEFGTDFSILPGEGYFVKCSNNGTLDFKGKGVQGELPLKLNSGWNLVGFHSTSNRNLSASDIVSDLSSQELFADMVMDWRYGKYRGYIRDGDEVFGFDFPISPLDGYFIRVGSQGVVIID